MKVREFIKLFIANKGKTDVSILPYCEHCNIEEYSESANYILGEYSWNLKERALEKSVAKSKKRFSKKHFFDNYVLSSTKYDTESLLNSEIDRISTSPVGHGGGRSEIYVFIKDIKMMRKY